MGFACCCDFFTWRTHNNTCAFQLWCSLEFCAPPQLSTRSVVVVDQQEIQRTTTTKNSKLASFEDAYMMDQDILEKTLESALGECLRSSYIASGIENVPVFMRETTVK